MNPTVNPSSLILDNVSLFRAAILGAAAGSLSEGPRIKTEQTVLANPPPAPKPSQPPLKVQDRNPARRKSSSDSQQEKRKETIWQFFEEGNKKGTCRYYLTYF